jgi:vancomycin resistance protein YoaR
MFFGTPAGSLMHMESQLRLALLITAWALLAMGGAQAQKNEIRSGKLSGIYTRFNPGNVKRTHNIRVAIKKINRHIISPGRVFSLNERLGKRTQANGYRTAIVFEDGKKVPGIGGGVSQVTGTLFNAALLAGLPIREYHGHTRPVPYLPVGRDATLAWGAKDLRFKNNTPWPIRISAVIRGNRLYISLYGAEPRGRQVRVGVGARRLAKHHIVAKLFRKTKQNGTLVSTELVGTSTYKWQPEAPD